MRTASDVARRMMRAGAGARRNRERSSWRRRCHRLVAAALIAGAGVRPALASTCVGDCRDDGAVDIADLIIGVNIALDLRPVADCQAFANPAGKVDVAQLVRGVNSALHGCSSAPTASVTTSAIDTPTATCTLTTAPANTPTITPTQPGDHFVDNGDGTITDTQSGFVWEKKDRGGGLHDTNTRYRWAGLCAGSNEICQPDAAAAATCEAATGGALGCAQCDRGATCNTDGFITVWEWLDQLNAARFAGHDDWRIPTAGRDGGSAQLEALVDQSVSGCGSGVPCVPPAFDTACAAECVVSGCSCTQADFYWSSTSGVGSPPFAWGVFFRTGGVIGSDKAAAFSARAVRG